MTSPQDNNQNNVKLYDLKLINQMCRGNQVQIAKMVDVFTEEISQSIEEINTAYSENDFLRIKKLTHKIKPTLAYFGTSNLEQELIIIENTLSKDIDSKELELKIISLNNLTKDVVNAMKTDFNITKK